MTENEMEIAREERMKLWRTSPFQCFPWETVKRVASNPAVKNVEDLETTLQKIVRNRSKK